MFAISSTLPPGGSKSLRLLQADNGPGLRVENGEFKGKKQEIKTTITTKGG